MRNFKVILIIIFFAHSNFIKSQDLILRKNARDTIKCKIIEENITNLKYKSLNPSDTIVYQINQAEIEFYLTSKKTYNSVNNKNYENPSELKRRKYHNITEIGYMRCFSKSEYGSFSSIKDLNSLSINTINGFQVNPNTYFGIGLGVDIWSFGDAKIPVFLDFRKNINEQLFIFIDPGYVIGYGAYLNCGIGLVVSKFLIFSLSYKLEQYTTTSSSGSSYWNNNKTEIVKRNASFINLKIGVYL